MLIDCRIMFGEKACYHLGGILEVERLSGGDREIPWSETIVRLLGPVGPKYWALLDTWRDERSDVRKQLDAIAADEGF
jgi:hypothetical protein